MRCNKYRNTFSSRDHFCRTTVLNCIVTSIIIIIDETVFNSVSQFRRFSGLKATPYHATNVVLHGLATGLVLSVARTVTCRRGALLSAALFAVHPVHADAVASVVGRADVLSCVFFLLSFLCYGRHVRARDGHRHHRGQQQQGPGCRRPQPCCTKNGNGRTATTAYLVFCVLFALLSMLSKENGISVMAVCIGYELMLRLRSIKKWNKVSGKQNNALKSHISSINIIYLHMHNTSGIKILEI